MTARCVKINVSLFCLYKYIFKFYSTNISLKTCKFWSFSLFESAPKKPNLVYVEMKVVNGFQEKTLIRIWLGKERINRFITGSNIQIKSRHFFKNNYLSAFHKEIQNEIITSSVCPISVVVRRHYATIKCDPTTLWSKLFNR